MSEQKGARTHPVIDEASAPFWRAARDGRFLIQRDPRTARAQWPPRPHTLPLWDGEPEWSACSGKGSVYTFSIIHRSSYGAPATPYVLAVVELDEGVCVTTNIVTAAPEAVSIGMRVVADFEGLGADAALVVFKPEGLGS